MLGGRKSVIFDAFSSAEHEYSVKAALVGSFLPSGAQGA